MENTSPKHLINDNLRLQKLYNELHQLNQQAVQQQCVKKNLKKIKFDTLVREFHMRLNREDF